MDERQKIAIDWKWDEPCWPMFNFRGTAANMAAMMTRRRCHWCGAEVMGFDGVDELLSVLNERMKRVVGITEKCYT